MPLIILCGYPSSGKTKRSLELCRYFRARLDHQENTPTLYTEVVHINDESLNTIRSEAYANATTEKNARGNFLAAVERALKKNVLVIADGMNYIKGFRYQLYCIARSLATSHCLVHCCAPVESAKAWNAARSPTDRYPEKIFDELIMRFEEPNAFNRWDSPLFTVNPDDQLDCQQFEDALLMKATSVRPNMATLPKAISTTDYVYELDRVTQEIINSIFGVLKNGPGNYSDITVCGKWTMRLPRPHITLAELSRIRRKFIQINKMHTIHDSERIGEVFVDYIQTALH